jgi:hypothetical protein
MTPRYRDHHVIMHAKDKSIFTKQKVGGSLVAHINKNQPIAGLLAKSTHHLLKKRLGVKKGSGVRFSLYDPVGNKFTHLVKKRKGKGVQIKHEFNNKKRPAKRVAHVVNTSGDQNHSEPEEDSKEEEEQILGGRIKQKKKTTKRKK